MAIDHGERITVCFVTSEYPPDWGGISKSARRIVGLLAAAGMRVHVFAPDRGTPPGGMQAGESAEVQPGVVLHRVKLEKESGEGAVMPFVNAIYHADRRERFDIFHGFFLPSAFPCLAVPERGDRPVIASIRGDDGASMLQGGPFQDAVRTVIKRASWITSVSSDSLVRAQQIADISTRSSFIPNSIDASTTQSWTLTPENRGVVGTLCTFRPKKDIPGLIRAYADVIPTARRQLRLVGDYFEGDTATREQIVTALADSGAAAQTEITGYIDNAGIARYLLGMNVFVLSSLHEGFPNTILEAAMLGLPIVATAVDGVKDIYGNSDAALLVPPGDRKALASAIQAVLLDEDLARRLSEASLRTAARFSHAAEQREWVALYRKLLQRV